METFTDTNHWEGILDFINFMNAGIYCNIHKATEAVNFVDDRFLPSVLDMERNNMIWGSYHYYRYQYDPTMQAQHYYNIAHNSMLPPIIDVEKINNYGASKEVFTARLKVLVDETERLWGRTPMIYTGFYAWVDFTTKPLWAKRCKLWMARYRNDIPTADMVPYPWTMADFIMWQYTDKFSIPPYTVAIDGNKFFGTREQLYLLANRVPPMTLEQRMSLLEQRMTVLEELCRT